MRREDRELWAEAYDKEYQGFVQHATLKIERLPPGAKILGTTIRTEYKVVNGVQTLQSPAMRNGQSAEGRNQRLQEN
jgi:hypothetical protein